MPNRPRSWWLPERGRRRKAALARSSRATISIPNASVQKRSERSRSETNSTAWLRRTAAMVMAISSRAPDGGSGGGGADDLEVVLPHPALAGVQRDVEEGQLLQRAGEAQAAGVDRREAEGGTELGDGALGGGVVAGDEQRQRRALLGGGGVAAGEHGVEGLDDRGAAGGGLHGLGTGGALDGQAVEGGVERVGGVDDDGVRRSSGHVGGDSGRLGGWDGEDDDLCALRGGGIALGSLCADLGGHGLGLLRVGGGNDDVVTCRDGGPAEAATHVAGPDDCDPHLELLQIVDGSDGEHETDVTLNSCAVN